MSKEKGGRCSSCQRKFGRHDRDRVDFMVGNVRLQRHLDCKELEIEVHPYTKVPRNNRSEEKAVSEVPQEVE